jgi:RNA-directed DNA polymerase
MIKASISLQDLRRRIYNKAKSEPEWRFWGLYIHVYKDETLDEAYKMAKSNNGAPGLDGVTFDAIEKEGRGKFLQIIQQELQRRTYKPAKNSRKRYPKQTAKSGCLESPPSATA